MTRFLLSCALLAGVLGSVGTVPVALASTIAGTPVQITGLDDLSATVDSQSRKGFGKIIAMGLGVAGLGGLVSGYHMTGAIGVGSGIGMGFLPGIISSSFDAAPAATTDLIAGLQTSTAWWAPLTAPLYPVFLLLRCLQDPVVWLAVALAVCLVHGTRRGAVRV
jgi:hypothetical protein